MFLNKSVSQQFHRRDVEDLEMVLRALSLVFMVPSRTWSISGTCGSFLLARVEAVCKLARRLLKVSWIVLELSRNVWATR